MVRNFRRNSDEPRCIVGIPSEISDGIPTKVFIPGFKPQYNAPKQYFYNKQMVLMKDV